MLSKSAQYTRHNESEIRSAVFSALDHKTVFNTISKLSTIVNNELISPVMITRLVVPTPEFESNIRNGLRAGIYSPEPIDFADLRQAFASFDQPTTWEIAVTAGLESIVRPLLSRTVINPMEFLRHSLATAAGCGAIADHLGLPRAQFIVAGLYHNVGLAVMANKKPDTYANFIDSLSGTSTTIAELENAEFAFTHEDVGSVFLMAATFPDTAWKSATSHHSSENTNDLVAAAVRVCANVAHQIGCTIGFANGCSKIHPALISNMGITDFAMADMAQRMSTAATQASKLAHT